MANGARWGGPMETAAKRALSVSDAQILIGGVQHETNTFSPLPTDFDSFRRQQFATGEDLIRRYRGTGTELVGMIDKASRLGMRLAPTVFAAATPSGIVRRDAFRSLTGDLCAQARSIRHVSGALMVLHGAMVAEDCDEADARILALLRAALGDDVPIVATLDFHANISRALVEAADVLVVYDTFPHADMAERGRDAARILQDLIAGQPKPAPVFRKIPLLPASDRQITASNPMKDIMSMVRTARRSEHVLSCSVAAGFPFADVAHLGMSVLTYGEAGHAAGVADGLADAIWTRRAEFTSAGVGVSDAVTLAETSKPPVILVDAADNVGGGAPGDGTAILAEMLNRGFTGATVVLWDPAGAEKAVEIGSGGRFDGLVGAHSGVDNGDPVFLDGHVGFAARVSYRRTGSYMNGTTVELGNVALVEAYGNNVVMTTERLMPFDTDHLKALKIRAQDQRAIIVKSGSAWRAAFGEIAETVVNVDGPGITSQQFHRLHYRKHVGELFPIA